MKKKNVLIFSKINYKLDKNLNLILIIKLFQIQVSHIIIITIKILIKLMLK